ncbi:MAG: right-handed parallel beta-helix repeat-containing protein [Candidatus Delongbacteria bacterium]
MALEAPTPWRLAGLLAVCPLSAALALVRQVPADWPTIQEAMQSSQDGDTILVAAGAHAGPVDFLGRAVRLASVAGAEATFLTAPGAGSIVRFVNGEGPGSMLEGFTLSGGEATGEAGLCGGALRVENSAPLIRGNILRDNDALLGGAVCLLQSGARLENNRIAGNQAEMGGGVYVQGGAPLFLDNQLLDNSCHGAGYGGGLALENCAATLQGNQLWGNSARLGGALSCRGTGASAVQLLRNSLAGNSASVGGALYLHDCQPELEACILAFSTAGEALFCNGAAPALRCNLVFGNAGGDEWCGTDLGGNLTADPLFCDLAAGDLRLQPGSPAWSTDCGTAGALALDCDGLDLPAPAALRPRGLWLDAPHPNPFNPATQLVLHLDQPAPVRLTIHDLAGRRVALLLDGPLPAGVHRVSVQAASWASGLYLAVAQSPHGTATRKLLLLR